MRRDLVVMDGGSDEVGAGFGERREKSIGSMMRGEENSVYFMF